MTLRELLEAALKSQSEFAQEMGVTRATVSRWVAGERMPSMAHVRKIIDILQLPREQVLAAIKETVRQHDQHPPV